MELILTGVGLILCMLTWRFMWMPTLLDTVRDRLFDLRDREVRGWFIMNGVSLDSDIYKALRDLLNGMLKNTESLTFAHFVMLVAWAQQHPEFDERRRKEIEKLFSTDDPRLQKLVKDVREKASAIILEYLVESSPPMIAIGLIGSVGVFLYRGLKWFKEKLEDGPHPSPMFRTRLAAVLLSFATVMGITSRASAQATVEEKAFSMNCAT